MKKMKIILPLLNLLIGIHCDKRSRHTNVAIVTDANGKTYHNYSISLVKHVLDGLSLLNYRPALFSTCGVEQKITDFQSRQCLLAKLKYTGLRIHSQVYTIKQALLDLNDVFPEDNYFILLVTSKPLYQKTAYLLNKVARDSNNVGIVVNAIGSKKSHLVTHKNGAPYEHYHHHYEKYNYIKESSTPKLNSKVKVISIRSISEVLSKIPLINRDLNKCNSQAYVKDECDRRCECVDGQLTNCYRVRKEFSSMSLTERQRFIDVYKTISLSKRFKKLYLTYVRYHVLYFWKGLHKFPQFLPWHRRYLLGFESYLRLYDCRVTIPFWNWALHHKHAWKATASHHTWSKEGGLGGNGDPNRGYCIRGGEFDRSRWKAPKYEKSEEILDYMCDQHSSERIQNRCVNNGITSIDSRCLRRRFNGKTPTYGNLYHTISNLSLSQFKKFEKQVREEWHNGMHNKIGGQMETDYSSHTPEFWMHHAMLDCAWEKWQQRGHKFKYNFYTEKRTKLLAFKPTDYRYKYVQNNNLGACGIKITCENVLPKPLPRRTSGDELYHKYNQRYKYLE